MKRRLLVGGKEITVLDNQDITIEITGVDGHLTLTTVFVNDIMCQEVVDERNGDALGRMDEYVGDVADLIVTEGFDDLDLDAALESLDQASPAAFDDEEEDAEEEETYEIDYRCPECGHEWQEIWSCACDSTCPACGLRDITALAYRHQV